MTNRSRFAAALAGMLIVAMSAPVSAWACDSCWGAAVDTPETRGIAMAMMALIGMTSLVWGGIGAFFLHVRRRARMLEPGDLIVTEYGDIQEKETGPPDDV